jgi:hypothetical protein
MITAEQKLNEANLIIKEFQAMRVLQKAYFKAVWDNDTIRKQQLLSQSKFQERKVDSMIELYNENKGFRR